MHHCVFTLLHCSMSLRVVHWPGIHLQGRFRDSLATDTAQKEKALKMSQKSSKEFWHVFLKADPMTPWAAAADPV